MMQFCNKNSNPFETYMFSVQFKESQINDNRTIMINQLLSVKVCVTNNRQRMLFPRLDGYFGVPFTEKSK